MFVLQTSIKLYTYEVIHNPLLVICIALVSGTWVTVRSDISALHRRQKRTSQREQPAFTTGSVVEQGRSSGLHGPNINRRLLFQQNDLSAEISFRF